MQSWGSRSANEALQGIIDYAIARNLLIDAQILHTVLRIGRCPCRKHPTPCPCPEAEADLQEYGHCHCGLFRRKP